MNIPNSTLKSLTRIITITTFILLIPLIAMQFSSEVNWNLFDFIIAFILLSGTGLIYELIVKRFRNKKQRIILGLLLLFGLFLIWAELAVGLFNTPFAGN